MTTTATEEPKQHSKLEIVQALYKTYVKVQVPNATPAQMAQAVKDTPEFQKAFSQEQDADRAARKLVTQATPNVEVPAWLIDGDHEKYEFKKNAKGEMEKKVVGKGALFLMPDGSRRFVNLGGPLTPAADVLAEFVFPGGEKSYNILTGETSYGQPPITSKPIAKKHNANPPATDLASETKKAFKMNKRGYIPGESFDPVLGVLTITENKDDIRFFSANEKGPASLSYDAFDKDGSRYLIIDDVQQACSKLGFSEATPLQMWKDALAGQPIVANGKLSIFIDRSDGDFWGGDGTLAALAASLKDHMVANDKKPGASWLSFKGMMRTETDPATGQPHEVQVECLPVGKKWLYRLETYLGDKQQLVYKGWARADQELDRQNRPYPPTLECVVKSGISKGTGKPYTMNEGAFVTYLNYMAGKPLPKGSQFQGVFDL